MDFSTTLDNLIKQHGITSYRLAKDLGFSPSLVGYWRKGVKHPTSPNLQKIADYFHVSMEYLMTGEEASQPSPPQDSEEDRLREKLSHYGFALQTLGRDVHDLTVPEMQDVSAVIDFLKAKGLLKDKEHTAGDKEDDKP